MKKIYYVPTFDNEIIKFDTLNDIRIFISTDKFKIFVDRMIINLLKSKNLKSLILNDTISKCGLTGLENVDVGYPIHKIILTQTLYEIEKRLITYYIETNDISYDKIHRIQTITQIIDKYYNFKDLVSFTVYQHNEDNFRYKLFKKSIKPYKEYLSVLKGLLDV